WADVCSAADGPHEAPALEVGRARRRLRALAAGRDVTSGTMPRAAWIAATTICALALVAALCGGGTAASAGFKRVHFRASDGVLLDGRLFGSGTVGIVLSHMGRRFDSQVAWLG